MSCEKCSNIVDRKDLPHCIRTCDECGRTMYVHEPGERGKGVRIRKGDTFVMPSEFLTFSLNPLESRGQFFKHGLQWFAELIFLDSLPKKKDTIKEELERCQERSDNLLRASALLDGLNIDSKEDSEQIIKTLKDNKQSKEWWALLSGVFALCASSAIDNNDAQQAAWAAACSERCRSMQVFKEQLEEVVWMGQSARRLVHLLTIWDSNRANSDEAFWQQTLTENSYALSQVFSFPVVFIRDQAYVGGMNVDRKGAKIVDYLLSRQSSHEALLLEIKTPTTQLLGQKYRGLFRPSAELSGSIVQVLDYRKQLVDSLQEVIRDTQHELSLFHPKCVLIVGNGATQLKEDARRKSFELFRTQMKDIDIVTYDEFFRKVEVLATLFNLVREKADAEPAKTTV